MIAREQINHHLQVYYNVNYLCSISDHVLDLLRSVVLEPEQGSVRIRILAAAILAELCPNPHIIVRDFDLPVELRYVPLIMPAFLAQVIMICACRGRGHVELIFLYLSQTNRSAVISSYLPHVIKLVIQSVL